MVFIALQAPRSQGASVKAAKYKSVHLEGARKTQETGPHHTMCPLSVLLILNLEKLQLARRNMSRPCHYCCNANAITNVRKGRIECPWSSLLHKSALQNSGRVVLLSRRLWGRPLRGLLIWMALLLIAHPSPPLCDVSFLIASFTGHSPILQTLFFQAVVLTAFFFVFYCSLLTLVSLDGTWKPTVARAGFWLLCKVRMTFSQLNHQAGTGVIA